MRNVVHDSRKNKAVSKRGKSEILVSFVTCFCCDVKGLKPQNVHNEHQTSMGQILTTNSISKYITKHHFLPIQAYEQKLPTTLPPPPQKELSPHLVKIYKAHKIHLFFFRRGGRGKGMDFIFVRFRKCPKILSSIVYNNVK